MFKKLTTGLALILSAFAFSQVGIGTESPHASSDLDLGATNKALYLNRVANPLSEISNPQQGMMLYDTTLHCVRLYQGNPAKWSDCLMGGDGAATSLTCGSATFSPASATQGTPYSGTLTIPYTGGNGGTYAAQTITQNGLTFTLPAGSFAMGAGNLVYNITGTPTAAGSTSVNVNVGGQSCTGLSLPVNAIAPTNATGTGSLSGRTCFDVVQIFVSNECGTIESRESQRADFTQSSVNTQTYTFTPSGTVSNVRFVFVNTNGQVIQSISGGNSGSSITTPVNATVTYYNNLNGVAAGKSRDQALLADIYVVYNNSANNTGTDMQLKLTARVQDCACCGAMVSPTVWKQFLCHNLGANTSLDPHVPVVGINGAYVAWGRRGPNSTGDSRVDWQTAPTSAALRFVAAPTSTNSNSGAVSGWNTGTYITDNYSWRTAANVKGANDPCPAGYRVPSSAEWNGVAGNNTISRTGTTPWTAGSTNYGNAIHYGSSVGTKTLTLPAAGTYSPFDNNVGLRGSYGNYWSSTTDATTSALAFAFGQTGTGGTGAMHRSAGGSIRCIAE